MLDLKDIKTIDKMMKENITDALSEFFERILVPYFDHEHNQNQKEHKRLEDKIDIITEYVKDHEKRISKLEVITSR